MRKIYPIINNEIFRFTLTYIYRSPFQLKGEHKNEQKGRLLSLHLYRKAYTELQMVVR